MRLGMYDQLVTTSSADVFMCHTGGSIVCPFPSLERSTREVLSFDSYRNTRSAVEAQNILSLSALSFKRIRSPHPFPSAHESASSAATVTV